MDFFASYSRPVPDASQDTFRTRPGRVLGRENNFIQIKEKNMYYYQILKNQKNKINFTKKSKILISNFKYISNFYGWYF